MGLFKGLFKILEIIYEEAEKEYYDETPYIAALDELHEQYERGEITLEELEKEEEEIIEALTELRKEKREAEGEE